jgi:hypothetical protein
MSDKALPENQDTESTSLITATPSPLLPVAVDQRISALDMRTLVLQLETEAAEIQKLSSNESVEPTEDTSEVSSDDELNTEIAQAESCTDEEEVVESENIEPIPQEQAQDIFESEQEKAQDGTDEIVALKDGSYW